EKYVVEFNLRELGLGDSDGVREELGRRHMFGAHYDHHERGVSSSQSAHKLGVDESSYATLDASLVAEKSLPSAVVNELSVSELSDLDVGTHVEARYAASNEWYGAVITDVTSVGGGKKLYALRYDDGDEEVDAHRLKLRLAGQRQRRTLCVGEAVDAVCRQCEGKILPGVVVGVGVGGGEEKYVVEFNLRELGVGDSDGVREELCRRYIFGPHFTPSNQTSAPDESVSDTNACAAEATPSAAAPVVTASTRSVRSDSVLGDLAVGTHVEARYAASNEWYGAVITDVTSVGGGKKLYALHYDDGDEEMEAHRLKLRLAGQRQRRTLSVGDDVDAECGQCEGKILP
ncbi:unnamed protein product, partial [Symbiodinium microadriaticum]